MTMARFAAQNQTTKANIWLLSHSKILHQKLKKTLESVFSKVSTLIYIKGPIEVFHYEFNPKNLYKDIAKNVMTQNSLPH